MNFRKYNWHQLVCVFSLLLFIAVSLKAQTTSEQKAVSPAPSPATKKTGNVAFSGNIRARLESWDWFESNVAENEYNYGAATLRLALSQQHEKVDWQVEGSFPLLLNLPTNAIAPGAQGQLGLGATYYAANGRQDAGAFIKQAFVRFKGKANSLKLGRFEFSDGAEIMPTDASLAMIKREHIAQRLIGTFGFTHVGRSFDGAHYVYNTKDNNFTFVAARPTEGVFQLRGWNQLNVDFYYGAYTKPIRRKTSESDWRVFAMHYHDGRRVTKTDNRPLGLRVADTDNIRLTTVGGHYISVTKNAASKVDLLLWGAGQFGDWGRLNHRAGAIAAEMGVQFSGPRADKLKPWLRAGYFRSTGDGNPQDSTHGTFFQILPTPRGYARIPFFNLMNNEDTFVQLRLKPHPKVSLRMDARYLRLSSANDLWFLGGGAFQKQTFGFIGRPSNGQKSLGTLLDASFDYAVNANTTLSLYWAGVQGGGVPFSIYPTGENARFAFIEVTRRF